jgi:hypothetical protein
MKLRICSTVLLSLLTFGSLNSQSISVNPLLPTIEAAIDSFFESSYLGLEVFNVSYTGGSSAVGSFTDGGSNFPMESGLVMSTGLRDNVIGPNLSGSTSFNSNGPGDVNLEALVSFPTYDACVIEFDFISCPISFDLNFILASEEYPEYVSSGISDVFGILLTGPNPGGGNYVNVNIATIPGTFIPVSIHNVNATSNSFYYNANHDSTSAYHNTTEFDGFTAALTASANIVACETYHLKIAIADGGDHLLDSGLFIEHPMNNQMISVSATVNDVSCSGSSDGSIYLDSIVGVSPFFYQWSSGSSGDSIVNLTPGTYALTVVDGQNNYSVHTYLIEIDSLSISLVTTPADPAISLPGSIVATVSNGISPYSYIWSNGASGGDSIEAAYGLHTVTITDSNGCMASAEAFVDLATSPGWIVENTAQSHIVEITNTTILEVQSLPIAMYDFIGAFYDSSGVETCGGYIVWQGFPSSILLYGDDSGTIDIEGFTQGDEISWKYWSPVSQLEYPAIASYDLTYPNQQFFQNNGSSLLLSLVNQSNLMNELSVKTLSIYPNPSEDHINISTEVGLIQSIQCYNSLGVEIINVPHIRLSSYELNTKHLSRGSYYLKINGIHKESFVKL